LGMSPLSNQHLNESVQPVEIYLHLSIDGEEGE